MNRAELEADHDLLLFFLESVEELLAAMVLAGIASQRDQELLDSVVKERLLQAWYPRASRLAEKQDRIQ